MRHDPSSIRYLVLVYRDGRDCGINRDGTLAAVLEQTELMPLPLADRLAAEVGGVVRHEDDLWPLEDDLPED